MALGLLAVSLGGCARLFLDHDLLPLSEERGLEAAERLTTRGNRSLEKGDLQHAETLFRRAMDADPSYGPAQNNLGRLQYERHDLYAAAWSFERAMEMMTDHPDPANNLAMTYEAAGKLDEAIELYETAHAMAPGNPVYLGHLVRAQIKREDPPELIRLRLQQLLAVETRSDWIDWAEYRLVLLGRPTAPLPDGEPEPLPLPLTNPLQIIE